MNIVDGAARRCDHRRMGCRATIVTDTDPGPPARVTDWLTIGVNAGAGFGVLLGAVTLRIALLFGGLPVARTLVGALGAFEFIGAGLVGHRVRPGNRTGSLMIVVGIAAFAEDLQLGPGGWISSIGVLVANASAGVMVHLLLAFPSGRLANHWQRIVAGAGYFVSLGLQAAQTLVYDANAAVGGRGNLLRLADMPWLSADLFYTAQFLGVSVACALVGTLVHRWTSAAPPLRRVLAPVYAAGLVGGVATGLSQASDDVGLRLAFVWVFLISFCVLPIAFVLGALHVRVGRTAVGDLLSNMAEPHSPDRLARALGDASVRIGYWRPESRDYVDGDGHALKVPEADSIAAVTTVQRNGQPIAALLHDPALLEDPHLLEAVGAAAALALDNQRLAAEVRAQLGEVRASRTRIVAAADDERRRLERDLHDGAQQRLVTTALTLRLVMERLDCVLDGDTRDLLGQGVDGLTAAMGELRELARGIHPTALTDAGLLAAVRELTLRLPLPVHVEATAVPRLDPIIEAAGYFVIAEAVTNSLKHSGGDAVHVGIQQAGAYLTLSVTDDGNGGVDLDAGSGLRGLSDRVAAVGGKLSIQGRPGVGTRVTAVLPCEALP